VGVPVLPAAPVTVAVRVTVAPTVIADGDALKPVAVLASVELVPA
jgi:hypothetical protein